MDSVKTKAQVYVTTHNRKCIAQIVAVAEKSAFGEPCFRIYVAWEWEAMASNGVFGFIKSSAVYKTVTDKAIEETADYGMDIGGSGEEKKIFRNLF